MRRILARTLLVLVNGFMAAFYIGSVIGLIAMAWIEWPKSAHWLIGMGIAAVLMLALVELLIWAERNK